ncbi:unnamed protein product [Caretta caretta]
MLTQVKDRERGFTVPTVAALKALENMEIPKWQEAVMKVTNQYPNAFATNKLQCGRTEAEVVVVGPDPKPQKQSKYYWEAEEGIKDTISTLMNQGVLVEIASICNSPIWPVLKVDKVTGG